MSFVKQPLAVVSLAMSCAAPAQHQGRLALVGVARRSDEAVGAHLRQLLMARKVPVVAPFALVWRPRSPSRALPMLALQACVTAATPAPVFLLRAYHEFARAGALEGGPVVRRQRSVGGRVYWATR